MNINFPCRAVILSVAVLCVFTVCTIVSPPLFSQETFGDLYGNVKDASGAAIAGATVTLSNKDTNRSFTVKTLSDGQFIAPQLLPGVYTVRFEMDGFAPVAVAGVEVLAGKKLKVDASLEVAPLQQALTVIDSPPLLDLTNTTVSHDVPAEEFDRIPKARSFQSLLLLSPSVNSGVDQYGNVIGIEGGFQVNGASAAENLFVIDGVPTNSLIQGQSRQNGTFEFLEDVQVKTGGMDAEYGGALGGVMSAITKSGGNSFHGEGHYYFAGNGISAAPIQRLVLDPNTQATASYVQDKKQADKRNEFGGSLGGYLIKDQLWFFIAASPQWRRASNDYTFSLGAQGTIDQAQLYQNLFGKLSYNPTSRIRTNFTWLNTPTYSTGKLPGYSYLPNTVTSAIGANQINKTIGFSQAQASYTGSVDLLLTNKSLLSLRASRFWDDYKDTGIPVFSPVQYSTSALSLPADLLATVPVALQGLAGFNNTPRLQRNAYNIAARTFFQADYSTNLNFFGSHALTLGVGTEKNVSKVNSAYPGGGYVSIFWNSAFSTSPFPPCNAANQAACRGTYGYYEVDDFETFGSAGATNLNLYIQDHWQVRPRLTLSLGLRAENETVPSFRPDLIDFAIKFGFGDKFAPRLGFAYDVLGNGKLKLTSSWGLYYDTFKYQLSQSAFGGAIWNVNYRTLDSPNVFALSGTNMPGSNLWNPADPSSFQNKRPLVYRQQCTAQDLQNCVAPDLKPMSTSLFNATIEYQWGTQTVLRGSYVHDSLLHAIEDLGFLVGGTSYTYIANPGEGVAKITPPSGATPSPIETPKPIRTYDAMELSITRRFSHGWFLSGSYVLSRLYGNYTGLADSDEIITPTMGTTFGVAQQQAGILARPGTNTNKAWDLSEILFDSHGNLDVKGRLPTDRPNVFKLYGSYFFRSGTELGGFFNAGSGTPVSTTVFTTNGISAFVNGRGDMGRTPFFSQTDMIVAQEFKLTESKKLRFEFNMLNLFNQKTARHIFTCLNKGCQGTSPISAINLTNVNLFQGYDYKAMIQALPGQPFDPRYGMPDLFNPGFSGRFGVKFIF